MQNIDICVKCDYIFYHFLAKSGLWGVRVSSDDPRMYINDNGKKLSHKTNEYYKESNNNNNNKLVERCNTTQTEECSRLF